MYHIRQVKTASKSTAIQVVYYKNRKRYIYKHIGSSKSDVELNELILAAQSLINSLIPTLPFDDYKPDNVLLRDKILFIGIYYSFLHELTQALINRIGLNKLCSSLMLDLSIVRLIEPASKFRSIELIETYFGIKHRRQSFYREALKWLDIKNEVEQAVVSFAKTNYSFSFDLIFYDVTTLYFETFEEDGLRRNGFSKDSKSQQPQILVALLVTKEGFPIGHEIFAGNTFEGHTILPSVNDFIRKHKVKEFTVVADAAMISSSNIEELISNNINYIVGARLANLPMELITDIDSTLIKEDNKSIRIKTDKGFLICSFSSKRYRKDKYEMEKQIEKVKMIVKSPSKNRKIKFTKTIGEKLEINQALIQKTQKLLGIKGYCTNLEETTLTNQQVIERYHELYKIEQAFRIAKNDLETRPIFHFKEEPIKLHLLICFISLVLSKHIELKTGSSIQRFITEVKKVQDARVINEITNKEIRIRSQLSDVIKSYLVKLNLPH